MRSAGAVLAIVAAGALFLVATDAIRWQRSMAADDVRFAFASSDAPLWAPAEIVPFGTARRLLGLEDDLVYRKAVRSFRWGKPRIIPFSDTDVLGRRGQAEELVAALANGNQPAVRRSAAANLLGALALANYALDPSQANVYLPSAADSFREAITLDPGNDDAKYNLELTLTRLRESGASDGGQRPPDTRSGGGAGAGTGSAGSGY